MSLTPKQRSKVRKTDVKTCQLSKGQLLVQDGVLGWECEGMVEGTLLIFRANRTGHPLPLPGKYTVSSWRPSCALCLPQVPQSHGEGRRVVSVLMGCCTSKHLKAWGDTCSSVPLLYLPLRGVNDFQLRCIANIPQQSH